MAGDSLNKPEIYGYDDFRRFLEDCYKHLSSSHKKYSYRKFAKDAGFSNPGYFNDVIKGRRKLSRSAIKKMIKVFDIPSKEQEFFELLVNYVQSKKEEDREEYYRQILFRRSRSSFTRINAALVKYYQDYRYPLVRTAIEVKNFKGDYEELSRFLNPSIPTNIVKKIVRDLCDWGLVYQTGDGEYNVTDKFVEPPLNLSQLIRQLNREWIIHGREAIGLFSPDERHISSILLGVSEKTRDDIRSKIEKFREQVFDLLHQDKNPEVLMQLNLQYFPRSNVEGKS